jgi:S-adenosyl-L-methionine hydrolase (adenosine-forming)
MPDTMIALLTDFGNDDPWVGGVKSSLLTANPAANIVDITHGVPPHDIFAGAFTLFRAYRDFPPWTIYLCVVDPGVGSSRRPILVVAADRYFIGPDNGLFSFIYQYTEVSRVIGITAEHYYRRPVSDTFHARDIFAPVAAWLSKGIESAKFGDPIEDYVKIPIPADKVVGDTLIKGEVCAIDRFGDLVTNIRVETLASFAEQSGKKRFKVLVAGQELPLVSGGYTQERPLFALINSSGLVEIAANSRSASEALGITTRGREVGVMAV